MPLALYTIKDSATSSIFVIFICSLWPMLINTAHGVASVRRDWLNVARTLEAGTLRTCFEVILPAAAPVILTGMRISMGIAWLVIVAAEMLVGNLGIGYFVWNEWNNLSLSNVIFAILVIGVVGMCLDLCFGALQRAAAYANDGAPSCRSRARQGASRARRPVFAACPSRSSAASSSASSATRAAARPPSSTSSPGSTRDAGESPWTGARSPAPASTAAWCSRGMP
jgi:hypothetical protein